MSFVRELKHLIIPFIDIEKATKNFTTMIGQGGYGPVYKGELLIGGNLTSVAVKRLSNIDQTNQGPKEFLTEIYLLSRHKHPNLVSLLGYCEEGVEKILIYEYAVLGSFDKYLKTPACRLSWRQRLNICIDAARGLDYLHNRVGEHHRIIHRDIKSANILLDQNLNAKIADLGLSRIGRANEKDTFLITNVAGTHGYCDPVFISTGVLTKKSDVYSFGVVLFEALCGRLCYMDVIGEKRLLPQLAKRCYKEGKLNDIIDLDLRDAESMKQFSKIADQCLHDDQEGRPSMDVVLQRLQHALELLEYEEACESQKLEEALGLQKLVETLQVQEFVESFVSQENDEDLESQELKDILELQTNYALVKAIQMMTGTPPTCSTKEELYTHLSAGFLVDEGNVWFSIDKNGKNQEMISAMKFMHSDTDNCRAISFPESRFPMVANIQYASRANMKVNIRTRFLSSNITYAVYLRYKHKSPSSNMFTRSVKYKVNTHKQSYISYARDYENKWMMVELFQTSSLKRDFEFNILLEEFRMDSLKSIDEVVVEGIVFLPIQKFDNEIIETEADENLRMCEIEWENRLPSDYKQFIYYRGKDMVKNHWNCVINETKEEAYSILTKGIQITVEDTSVLFWITKSNGKKCFMLRPPINSMGRGSPMDVKKSRLKYPLRVTLHDQNFLSTQLKLMSPLLSTNSTYVCYLVYEIHSHKNKRNPLGVYISQDEKKSENDILDNGGRVVYLRTPEIPVIGPNGEVTGRSPTTLNKPDMTEFPIKRRDGHWEVLLWKFNTHNGHGHTNRPRIFPNHADEDDNITAFPNLCPYCDTTITLLMLPPFHINEDKTERASVPILDVYGIEFRTL